MESPVPNTAITAGPLFIPISPGEERTWATIAHLSVLLNLITGWLGPVAALVVYIAYKDRSKYIRFHALQSLLFQLAAWILPTILVVVLWISSFVLLFAFGVGLLLIPFAILFSILLGLTLPAMIIYGIIGALECSAGRDFRYWMVGEWTEKFERGETSNETEKAMGDSAGAPA